MALYSPFCYCTVVKFDKCRIFGLFCNLPCLCTFACYVFIHEELVFKTIFFIVIDVGFTLVY